MAGTLMRLGADAVGAEWGPEEADPEAVGGGMTSLGGGGEVGVRLPGLSIT